MPFNYSIVFFAFLILIKSGFAQPYFLKKPIQVDPLSSMTLGRGILESNSLLKSPGLGISHEVDYLSREVNLFGFYRNTMNSDTTKLWQSVFPEVTDYSIAMADASRMALWKNSFIGQENSAYGNSDAQFDLQLPFTVPSWLKGFELDKPKLELSGELSFGVFGNGVYTEGVQDVFGRNTLVPMSPLQREPLHR